MFVTIPKHKSCYCSRHFYRVATQTSSRRVGTGRELFFFYLPKWLSSAQKSLQDPRCSNPATHAHRAAGHKRQGWDAQTFSTRQPRRRRQSSASLSRGYIRSVCLICYVLLLKRASFQLLGRISEYYCSIAGFTFRPFFWCRRALAKCIYVYQCSIECQFQLWISLPVARRPPYGNS